MKKNIISVLCIMKYKRKIHLLLYILFFATCSVAQNTFQKIYPLADKNNNGANGELGYSAQQTMDNGIIIAGTSLYPATTAFLRKTDGNGNLLWTKNYGITGTVECKVARQTKDGGYILAGNTSSGFGEWVFLAKTNGNGDMIWSRIIEDTTDSYYMPLYCYDIEQTNDNGYIITGQDENPAFTYKGYDMILLKTDSVGTIQWEKSYGIQFSDENGASVKQTADSGYAVCGHTTAGSVMIKTTATGDLIWNKLYNTELANVYSVIQTTDGGYALTGTTASSALFLLKTDTTGNPVWTKEFGKDIDYINDVSFAITGRSIAQTSDGGFVVAGLIVRYISASIGGAGPNLYIIKTNSTGDSTWTKEYGDSNYIYGIDCNAIQQVNDKGYIIIGSRSADVYLIKTDSNGHSGCTEFPFLPRVMDTSISVNSQTFTVTNLQTELVDSPFTTNSVAINTTVLCTSITPVNWQSFTAEKKDTTVLLNWSTSQEENNRQFNIERSADGINFTFLGSQKAAYNSSSIENYEFTDEKPLQGENFYRLKQIDDNGNLSYSVTKEIDYTNAEASEITIAPNPVFYSTAISLTLSQSQKVSINIYDVTGKLVTTLVNSELRQGIHQFIWNAANEKGNAVSSGVYFLKTQTGNSSKTRKLILLK